MNKILELIEKRSKFPISNKGDEWIENIFENEFEDIWIICSSSELQSIKSNSLLNKLVNSYYIEAIFELDALYQSTGTKFLLCHIVNSKPTYIRVSLFEGKLFIGRVRTNKNSFFETDVNKFSSIYKDYLNNLEQWISTGIVPTTADEYGIEYKTIEYKDMEEDGFSPRYFSNKAIEVRKMLSGEKIQKLGDLVEILTPHITKNGEGRVFRGCDRIYPLPYRDLEIKDITNIKLQKNDILLPRTGFNTNAYLVADDLTDDIYVSNNLYVLRHKENVSPEYLYLYLNSEVFQTILESKKKGSVISHYTAKSIAEMPVIVPTKEPQEYKIQAYALTHIERSYENNNESFKKGMMTYYAALQNAQASKVETIEDVLSIELLNTLRRHSNNQLDEMLQSDWKELNDCFRVKAYKATLILAGSILEAVLIDWLSEIHGRNYFEEDYMVTDRNGRTKRADLIDYINEIKYIERPNWMAEADKAHEIRKKRNLVHAKLGINSDEINEETCRMVIDYLQEVLETRIS